MICIDDEIPFEIPVGWEWCRLREITSLISKGSSPSWQGVKYVEQGIPFITSENVREGYIDFSSPKFLERSFNELQSRSILKQGDILTNIVGASIGRTALFDLKYDNCNINQAVAIIRLIDLSINTYVLQVLNTPFFITQMLGKVVETARPNISLGSIENLFIPIPPSAEQKRIIAQLLFILPFITHYKNTQKNLEELNASIKNKLHKSILQEAIQGRLVPQDSNDEPATILLERIKTEKLKLVKEGKLKKKDIVDSVIFKGDDNKYYEIINGEEIDINDELPFEIPDSWSWTRLGFITSNEAGLSYNKEYLNDETGPFIRVLRGGNIEEGRWFTREDDVIISQKYVKNCLLLKKGTFITPAVTSIERMAKTALIEDDQKDVVVGGFVLMIKPFMLTTAFLQYLNLFFQTTYYKQYCIGITNKSGQAFYNLSRQKLMQCFVPIPPIEEQRRIVEKYSLLSL